MTEAANRIELKPMEFVSFRVGAQEYCIDIMAVREIRGWMQATPLPHAPNYVCGMVNLRGVVLPVIDMSVRLGLPNDEPGPRRVIIVVCIGRKLVGLLVDAVCDILGLPPEGLQAPPELLSDRLERFIGGVMTIESRVICLLALEHLLSELDAVAA